MQNERAERAAARRNQRQADRYPLLQLSGDLHTWTGDEMQAEWDRYRMRLAVFEREQTARAEALRDEVSKLVSADRLRELDEQRQVYPSEACYSCDFWRRILRELTSATR